MFSYENVDIFVCRLPSAVRFFSAGASLAMAPPGALTPDQQTVVLVNTFCAQTVEMLNAVSATCERKLADASTRIRGVETKLAGLEAKLASVKGEGDTRDGA